MTRRRTRACPGQTSLYRCRIPKRLASTSIASFSSVVLEDKNSQKGDPALRARRAKAIRDFDRQTATNEGPFVCERGLPKNLPTPLPLSKHASLWDHLHDQRHLNKTSCHRCGKRTCRSSKFRISCHSGLHIQKTVRMAVKSKNKKTSRGTQKRNPGISLAK